MYAAGIGIVVAVLAAGPVVSAQGTAGAAKPAATAAARVVTITGTDAMKFDPNTIQAKPGERLKVVLKAVGTLPKVAMAHNFVLLAAGTDVTAFVNASALARPDFIAPALKKQVLASTGLAGAGETVSVELTAPSKPGQYPFVCSFPGHFISGMKGMLVVK
jgi:azurin